MVDFKIPGKRLFFLFIFSLGFDGGDPESQDPGTHASHFNLLTGGSPTPP